MFSRSTVCFARYTSTDSYLAIYHNRPWSVETLGRECNSILYSFKHKQSSEQKIVKPGEQTRFIFSEPISFWFKFLYKALGQVKS